LRFNLATIAFSTLASALGATPATPRGIDDAIVNDAFQIDDAANLNTQIRRDRYKRRVA